MLSYDDLCLTSVDSRSAYGALREQPTAASQQPGLSSTRMLRD